MELIAIVAVQVKESRILHVILLLMSNVSNIMEMQLANFAL